MPVPVPMRYEKTAAVSDDSGHSGGVAAVAFSPNDMLLASAGLDHKVCIWRTSNGQLMHTFVAASAVLSLAWVLSQCLLLCGTQDGSVLALSVTQSQLHAISFPRSHNFPVEHLAAHGDRLASGSHEELAIWERTDGQWKHLLDLPQPPKNSTNEDSEVLVTSIHWTRSKDHSSILLVTYLYHGYVIYDTRGWRRLLTTPLNGYIASASITADGQKLVVSNMASGFDIYETATGNSLGTLNHAVGRVFAVPVLFVHGGNAVIAGSTVGEVHLWNVSTLRLHQILRLNAEDIVLALDAHYDSSNDRFMIATGVSNQNAAMAVALWYAEDGSVKKWRFWLHVKSWILDSDCFTIVVYLFLGLFIGGVSIALAVLLTRPQTASVLAWGRW